MKEIQLDFATIRFIDDNIVVSEINGGIDLDNQKISMLLDTIEKNVSGSYAYISNRIHAYSVDWIRLISYLQQRTDFCCYGVVSYRRSTEIVYGMEEMIFGNHLDIPISLFHTLDGARKWARDQLSGCIRHSA